MNKRILAIVVVLVIIIGGAWYLFFHHTPVGTTTTPSGQNPFGTPAGNVQQGTGNTSTTTGTTLETRSGSTVAVPNLTQGKTAIPIGANQFYFLTNNQQTQGDQAQFDILYGTDSSISIGLFQEPLAQARLAAEAQLRNILPLSNAQLCSLKVSVEVPYSVNQFYAGQELGLSFCPGAVTLPN